MKLRRPIRLRGTARNRRRASRGHGEESGYTLLLVVFFAAVMIIAASVAIPNLITQERRQKEQQLIWRGRQYARAIGLYYHKTGHFPHDLKELKKGVADIHFLRKDYKDPMNGQDGSWRLIYLGPGGQLIGSLRYKTLAQYEAVEMGRPVPKANTGIGGKNGKNGKPSTGQGTGEQPPENDSFSQPHQRIINEGDMMGGNLIGVASKVKAKSLKVYMGGHQYIDWEFIWNPLQGKKLGLGAPPQPGGKTPPKSGTPTSPTSPTPAQPQQPQQSQQP